MKNSMQSISFSKKIKIAFSCQKQSFSHKEFMKSFASLKGDFK